MPEPAPHRGGREGGPAAVRILAIGNLNVDVLMGDLAPWPAPGGETLVDRFGLRVGGSLGSFAGAMAALGREVDYVVEVGDDHLGRWLRDELAPIGLDPAVSSGPTAVTVALSHPDKERTFVTYPGHMARFDAAAHASRIDALRPGDLLLLSGYFLLPSLRAHAPELLERARAVGARAFLDTGWPSGGWDDATRAEVRALLPRCDGFLPNRSELTALYGDDLEGALRRSEAPATVVKDGAAGARWRAGADAGHARAPRVEAVDTVGAGDAFNAGFLDALADGLPLRACVAAGVRVASAVVASSPRRFPDRGEARAGLEPAPPRS